MKRLTIKNVTKAIQQHYPHVELVKGEGYFYIVSDDPETALKIAGLFSSSIGVYKLNDLTLEQWVQSVKSLFENKYY